MSEALSFPPLLTGRAVAGDPVAAAVRAAEDGADPGLLLFDPHAGDLALALVLAPEVPLAQAAQMIPLGGVALQNALGAIAPPEVGLELGWDGTLFVNGGKAGRVRLIAPTTDANAEAEWLVLAIDLAFEPRHDEGGAAPDETALKAEGCGELTPADLLESWSRHFLTQLHRWEEDGIAPLHREWTGLARGLGADMAVLGETGYALGIDEAMGLLLKTGGTTKLLPLTRLLDTP